MADFDKKPYEVSHELSIKPLEEIKKTITPPNIDKYKFHLNEIEVVGLTLLPKEKVIWLKEDYEDKSISLSEVYEFIARLNRLYIDEGYFTCLAYLPQQKIKNGKVVVQVVEGKLGDFNISGAQYTKEDFIRNQVNIPSNTIPKVDDLNKKIRDFNILRGIQLAPTFSPGKEMGTTNLNVEIKEPRRYIWQLYFDNAGSKQNGTEQIGVIFRNLSLSGYGDPATVGVNKSEGNNSIFFDYQRPIKLRDSIGASISYSSNKVIEEPRASLNINGNGKFASLSYNHVFKVWNPMFSQFKTGIDYINNDSKVGIVKTETEGKRFWISNDFAVVKPTYDFFTSITLNYADVATKGFAGKNNDVTSRLNISTKYKYKYSSGVYISAHAKAQFTNDKRLPTPEQWAIGGNYSLRNLESASISGDKGWDARLSLGIKKKLSSKVLREIDTKVFYNKAKVESDQDLGLNQDTFKDWGVEINASWWKNINLSLV